MTSKAQDSIKLEQFSLEELVKLKQRFTEDLRMFLNSFNGLKSLEQKFEYSKVLVDQIEKKAKIGDELMIPMTTSLFIPGKLKSNKDFLVELGTGYFAEFSADEARAYCSRKCAFTKDTSSKVQEQMDDKRIFIEKINMNIQKKVQERQEQIAKANAQK